MCQTQFGNCFGAIAPVAPPGFRPTCGTPGEHLGPDEAERGFCRDCGTPPVGRFPSSPGITLCTGALDRHSEMKPWAQHGIETREPRFAELAHLPRTVSGDGSNGSGDRPEGFGKIRLSSRRHPDPDAAVRPAASRR
jgi:hypothetical protein